MTAAPDPEVVDAQGASPIVGLTVATLATLRCRGGGPPFLRLGRAVRYRVDLLRQWRDERLVMSTADTSTAERKGAAPVVDADQGQANVTPIRKGRAAKRSK